MNELDQKILDLFKYLINSETQYLDKIDYNNHKLLYKIGSREISLSLCRFILGKEREPNSYSNLDDIFSCKFGDCYFWEVVKTVENEIGYRITVEGKTYNVPKLQRVEQALTLDKIDSIIRAKESGILDSVLIELTPREVKISEEF